MIAIEGIVRDAIGLRGGDVPSEQDYMYRASAVD